MSHDRGMHAVTEDQFIGTGFGGGIADDLLTGDENGIVFFSKFFHYNAPFSDFGQPVGSRADGSG